MDSLQNLEQIFMLGPVSVYKGEPDRTPDYYDPEKTPEIDTEAMKHNGKETYVIKIGNNAPHKINGAVLKFLISQKEEQEIETELGIRNHGLLKEELSAHHIPLQEFRIYLALIEYNLKREKQFGDELTQEVNYF